jgi:hypothetical protein
MTHARGASSGPAQFATGERFLQNTCIDRVAFACAHIRTRSATPTLLHCILLTARLTGQLPHVSDWHTSFADTTSRYIRDLLAPVLFGSLG